MIKSLLICLCIPVLSFAQEITPAVAKEAVMPKNEFGFHVASASILSGYEDEFGNVKLNTDYNFFDGVYYKRHFGKWALRFSFNYHQQVDHYDFNRGTIDFVSKIDHTREMIYRTGAERSFGTGKVQFYVLADLNFMFRDFKREEVGTGRYWPYSARYHNTTYGPGLLAGLGVRYNPTKNITLFYEANLMVNLVFDHIILPNYPDTSFHDFEGRINVGTFGIGIRF